MRISMMSVKEEIGRHSNDFSRETADVSSSNSVKVGSSRRMLLQDFINATLLQSQYDESEPII